MRLVPFFFCEYLTSTQPVSKLQFSLLASCGEVIFNFCPSWVEVGFWTSDQLGWRLGFYSRQVVGKLILEILSNLGRIIFLQIFSWNASKNAFLVGYHWEGFFLRALPKTPIPSATTWRIVLKIAAEARIKSLVSLATIWGRLWTKCDSHRLPLERKFPAPGTNLNVFSGGIWRNFSKTRW